MIFRNCVVLFRLALLFLVGVVEASAQKAPSAKPFERFDGSVLEPDKWTDGDSFRVRLPDGRLETFRLYFVDTTESRSRGKFRWRSERSPRVDGSRTFNPHLLAASGDRCPQAGEVTR